MVLHVDPRSWPWRLVRSLAVLMFIIAAVAVADAKPNRKGEGGTCKSPKVTCSPAGQDATPPAISIVSPADGSSVSGRLTVTGTAADDGGVRTVAVRLNDGPFQQADGTQDWSFTVDETMLPVGPASITARATDNSSNSSETTVHVHVDDLSFDEPPTIAITSPRSDAAVPSSFRVEGLAHDDVGIVDVAVRHDDEAFTSLGPVSSWAHSFSGLSAGPHVITARATDTAGATTTTRVGVEVVPDGAGSFTSVEVPQLTWESVVPLGRGRAAENGSISALLFHTEFSHEPSLFFRDASTGAARILALPADSTADWWGASYAWSGDHLWVLSGGGPITVRRYLLSGTPLPTAASLLEVIRFGDGDSRPGDLITLSGGGVVAAWHQQGKTGPQGQRVAYRGTGSTSWSVTSLSYLPSKASKDVLAEHPADGSVWLFTNPDGWSSIGAARFDVTRNGLTLDRTDAYFIDENAGPHDADPENPDLAVAADPSSGELVLAYQSSTRKRFSATVIGSYPSVARIDAAGSLRFDQLPVYVERVSGLGLVVRDSEIWLAYRPVEDDLSFDDLWVARSAGGTWPRQRLGSLHTPYQRINYGIDQLMFSSRMGNDRVRVFHG